MARRLLTTVLLLASTVEAFAPPPSGEAWRHRTDGIRSVFLTETEGATASVAASATPAQTAVAGDDAAPKDYLEKAAREDALFRTDARVGYWRELNSEGNDGNLRRVTDFFTSVLPSSTPLQRAVWGSFLARSGFFGVNAVSGNLLAEGRGGSSMFGDIDIPFRIFELIQSYDQELRYIEQGTLKYPWDYIVQRPTAAQPLRLQLRHRQSNPLFALEESWRLLSEAPAILERRSKFQGRPSGSVPMMDGAVGQFQYPRYYLNDFHYQTDGWLSAESALRYEMSSETIFLGSQDVMQRQTLLPLLERAPAAQRVNVTDSGHTQDTPASILEVACGTGRFATFVRDNFPSANMTLTDLSPFYLDKATENDRYWREYRGREAMRESTGVLREPSAAAAVQANAEELPFPDNSFDAVLCVYLFHELPAPARRRAAAEMARVVKPGGTVVLTDSIQLGDRKAFGTALDNFRKFNEPHYVDYVRADLPALFTNYGLVCDAKYVNSRTKTLSFIKP